MGQEYRRFIRTLGLWGILGVVLAGLGLVSIAVNGLSNSANLLRVFALLAAGLFASAAQWGSYTRSVETAPYRQILDPLMASREEFCLLLRPFGSDGEVLVRQVRKSRWRYRLIPLGTVTPTLTLEQVVAAGARRRLGVKALAMVDQDRLLAPPGPVYLRAPHAEWKQAAGQLIRRAHTIVVLLPPRQDLRAALEWELKQIIRHRRQSRVVIVLPPCDRRRYDHARARRQVCVLLAALLGLPNGITDVPTSLVEKYLAMMPDRVHTVRISQDGTPEWWYTVPRRLTRIYSDVYEEALDQALARNESDVAGLGFTARYARPAPRTGP